MFSVGALQNSENENLELDLSKIEESLFDQLARDLALYATAGQLVISEQYLASLEDRIINYMEHLGYRDRIDAYTAKYGEIDANNVEYYERMKLLREAEAIDFDSNRNYRRQIMRQLKGDGLKINYVDKVSHLLRQNALLGITVNEATSQMQALMTKNGDLSLTRYAGQITMDSFMQYDGLQNENFRRQLNLKNFYYVASVIETSRPFCVHLKKNYVEPISDTSLRAVLNDFCPSGIPSDEVIEYTTVSNEIKRQKKGSGMIEGTVFQNFSINRGGHNCRHEVKWTAVGKQSRSLAQNILKEVGFSV